MKKPIALLLTLSMCVALLIPFGTLGASAAATSGESVLPEDGTTLYSETFSASATSKTADTLTALNKTADAYSLANWSVLSGSGELTLSGGSDGALTIDATQDLLLQVFAGENADLLAKTRDYMISFDLTYNEGCAADDYMGLRFNYKDPNNYIATAVCVRGDGWLTARYGGVNYALEDDGVKATAEEVGKGSSSIGHKLHSLRKTDGTTLLTLLNGTDSTINETYAALAGKTLHYCVESIHGAGVIVSINGVVVSTTVKNVYYYDALSEAAGTIALYFSAGTKATLDNLTLTAGGSFTLSTNSMGITVMSVNTLFSSKTGTDPNDIYSMHWLVDDEGTLRMDALLAVIEAQSPDIVGFQERNYTKTSGSGQENDIVEAMIAMGYGIVANKLRSNAVGLYPDDVPTSRYDSYNYLPIFYKTSKFILMNDSNRETEYVLGVDGVTDVRVANGTKIFSQSSRDNFMTVYDTSRSYNVQLLIGEQKNSIDTEKYQAVTVRYYGRCYAGISPPQKTAVELRKITEDPTKIEPVCVEDTTGWLDVTMFGDGKFGEVTYNASTGKVVYNGTSYKGAYYARYATEPIAVLLTNYTGTVVNPNSTLYTTFNPSKYNSMAFPCGYVEKNVNELRYKSAGEGHVTYTPVTLTSEQLATGDYLDATMLTQAQFNSITFQSDGTATYDGRTYAGVYYVRSRMTGVSGEGNSKGVTWAVLRLRENGQLILAMNTHCALLLSNGQQLSDGEITQETAREWRIDNAREILEVMETVFEKYGELPAFITGDFNMGNDDPMYSALTEVFDDAARLAPNTVYWEGTWHSPTKITVATGNVDNGNPTFYYKDTSSAAYPVPSYPIDHIFTTADDFTVRSYNVLNDIYDEKGDKYDYGSFELHMSDHCALMVEMEISGVGTPGCSHKNGIYSDPQTVTLSAASKLDTIYYTTDGTDPTSSETRQEYTGPFEIYGDVQLRAVSCRAGAYSKERTVSFAVCAELAITEIICNPDGWDILEGFEVVNTSNHSVDLADYTFWSVTDSTVAIGTGAAKLADSAIDYTYTMRHMRVNEQGKYILQPGEVFFLWTVMGDAYYAKLTYAAGQSAYAMDFVTEEGLNDPATVALWESLGYTGLDKNSVGKAIYRTDLASAAFAHLTGCEIAADHIVPMDVTTAVAIFPYDSATKTYSLLEGTARKDMQDSQKNKEKDLVSWLSGTFNMGNSAYTRLFITYTDELTAENAFATATLDDRNSTGGMGTTTNEETNVTTPSIYAGSFTMMPTLDQTTGKITSTATAFNAWSSAKNATSGFSIGELNTAEAFGATQRQDVSSYVAQMSVGYHHISILGADGTAISDDYVASGETLNLPAAPTGDGVFVGWRDSSDALYAAGCTLTVSRENTFTPFFLKFATLAGASIRTTTGSTGLRFLTELDKEGYDTLVSLVGGVKMGTYIVPQYYVTNAGKFDVSLFAKHIDVKTSGFYREDDTTYTLAGSVANIYTNHYTLDYAACGYLAFQYADGADALIYAAVPADGARNVIEVAEAAYKDRASSYSEAYPNETEKGDYSPYTNSQLCVIYSFLSTVMYMELDGGEYKLSANMGETPWIGDYDDNADTMTFTRTDGTEWNTIEVYFGDKKLSFTVQGEKLIVQYTLYTDRY